MSTLKDKWVRILADFCADPVWEKGGGNADLADLPVSTELSILLDAWAVRYSRFADKPDFNIQEHSDRGLALARQVKEELPEWTVIYLDEARAMEVSHEHIEERRSYYEYEITL